MVQLAEKKSLTPLSPIQRAEPPDFSTLEELSGIAYIHAADRLSQQAEFLAHSVPVIITPEIPTPAPVIENGFRGFTSPFIKSGETIVASKVLTRFVFTNDPDERAEDVLKLLRRAIPGIPLSEYVNGATPHEVRVQVGTDILEIAERLWTAQSARTADETYILNVLKKVQSKFNTTPKEFLKLLNKYMDIESFAEENDPVLLGIREAVKTPVEKTPREIFPKQPKPKVEKPKKPEKPKQERKQPKPKTERPATQVRPARRTQELFIDPDTNIMERKSASNQEQVKDIVREAKSLDSPSVSRIISRDVARDIVYSFANDIPFDVFTLLEIYLPEKAKPHEYFNGKSEEEALVYISDAIFTRLEQLSSATFSSDTKELDILRVFNQLRKTYGKLPLIPLIRKIATVGKLPLPERFAPKPKPEAET